MTVYTSMTANREVVRAFFLHCLDLIKFPFACIVNLVLVGTYTKTTVFNVTKFLPVWSVIVEGKRGSAKRA